MCYIFFVVVLHVFGSVLCLPCLIIFVCMCFFFCFFFFFVFFFFCSFVFCFFFLFVRLFVCSFVRLFVCSFARLLMRCLRSLTKIRFRFLVFGCFLLVHFVGSISIL